METVGFVAHSTPPPLHTALSLALDSPRTSALTTNYEMTSGDSFHELSVRDDLGERTIF